MKTRLIFIPVLLFALIACVDEPPNTHQPATYRVDPDLKIYVERFQDEAKKRGRNFNFETSGLIVEFANLKDNVAGLCYTTNNPIKIQIDRDNFIKVGKYRNGDLMREDVMFHELGHGFLRRDHNNAYLPNSDWKTMMCGGDTRDNRSWNINYRGMRREYYLDELFNQSTPAPWWATDNPDFSDINYDTHANDEFTTPSTHWITGNSNTYNVSISGGVYSVTTTTSTSIYSTRKNINTSILDDFYLEVNIKIISSDKNSRGGIIWGSTKESESNYFYISNAGRMFPENSENYGWYTELIKPSIKANDFNLLALRKMGQFLYYYINNTLAYIDEIDSMIDGNDFGIIISGNSTLQMKSFKLSSTTTPPLLSLRSASASEGQISAIETPKQNVVKKR